MSLPSLPPSVRELLTLPDAPPKPPPPIRPNPARYRPIGPGVSVDLTARVLAVRVGKGTVLFEATPSDLARSDHLDALEELLEAARWAGLTVSDEIILEDLACGHVSWVLRRQLDPQTLRYGAVAVAEMCYGGDPIQQAHPLPMTTDLVDELHELGIAEEHIDHLTEALTGWRERHEWDCPEHLTYEH